MHRQIFPICSASEQARKQANERRATRVLTFSKKLELFSSAISLMMKKPSFSVDLERLLTSGGSYFITAFGHPQRTLSYRKSVLLFWKHFSSQISITVSMHVLSSTHNQWCQDIWREVIGKFNHSFGQVDYLSVHILFLVHQKSRTWHGAKWWRMAWPEKTY